MMRNTEYSSLLEPADTPTKPELLVSALLHLMSHYTAHLHEKDKCLRLAAVIERHLKVLSTLPGLSPLLQATCLQLADDWTDLVDQNLPRPEKSKLMSRLASATGLA
jgi:hypothetical protein